ncbi:PucR family transcriptional regulator ligand-binding domain-containing protein [Streptomyces variegatus]|uniref:PucR family transcriptional regulator ligand-binding domain-containing protein n=1 Tax=Streptomyces variegatus TaxID=284040 RepID=UPI003C2E4E36
MPDPAAPPTPPVPLTALLAREDLALRQIAGPPAGGVVVHWVHTSEMADPYPYLLGGELLLTAGVHIPEAAGPGAAYFDDYVSRIVAAGGAALGFGLAPVHDTVPEALVAACASRGLPLLEVPPRTTFSGVARAVWQLMARARLAELRRVTEAQQSLAAAASRPDPVPSVLRQLAQRLGGWAVLYGPEGAEIAGAGRRPGEEARAALTRLTEVVRPVRSTPRASAAPETTGARPTGPAAPARPDRPTPPASATPRTGAVGARPTGPTASAQPDRPTPPASAAPHPDPTSPAGTTEGQPAAPADPAQPDRPTPPTSATPSPGPTSPAGTTAQPAEPADPAQHRPTPPASAAPHPDPSPPAGTTEGQPAAPADPARPGRPTARAGAAPRTGAVGAWPAGSGAVRSGVSPRPDAGPDRSAPASVTDPDRPAPSSATDSVAGLHLAAYSLGAGHGFVLGVATPQRAPGDHTVASVAAVLLSLLTGEQQSGTGAARSSALVRLLLGAPPEEVASLLGDGPWLVVHARPDGDGAPDPVAASALGAALGSALVDPAGEVVRVLVPADRAPAAPLPGWTLGVSAAVAPYDWPAADIQAARALARARATRAPLLGHAARPALADLVPPGEAAAHARTLLAPVTAHPALTETLRTWLSLHGGWDRTAVALSVHRNTVRQRIARCATLLETDLDDPDVRMELWFALRQL